jgi:hypothetical protein
MLLNMFTEPSTRTKTRPFKVEWRDYLGEWHYLYSVQHLDLDGAAFWARRQLREALAVLGLAPKTVVCPRR